MCQPLCVLEEVFKFQEAGWNPKEQIFEGDPNGYRSLLATVHALDIDWDQRKETILCIGVIRGEETMFKFLRVICIVLDKIFSHMIEVLEFLGVKPQLLKGNLSLGLPNMGYIIWVLGIGRLSKSKSYIKNTVKFRYKVCNYFLSDQIGKEYKAYAVAAKLYNQISKPTQNGEICISLMTRWWFEHTGNIQLDTSATEKAFGFLFGWLLGSLKHEDYPLIMKTSEIWVSNIF